MSTALHKRVYDPYGNVTFCEADWSKTLGPDEQDPSDDGTTSDYAAAVLFAGYRRDAETGLYHVRHRMYHVRLGLWLIRDPEGYVDGMSLYEYVRSTPAGLTDPQGKFGGDLPDRIGSLGGELIRRAGEQYAQGFEAWKNGDFIEAVGRFWVGNQAVGAGAAAGGVAGAMDYVDPIRRMDRAKADYEANLKREFGNWGDASAEALLENWPVIDVFVKGAEGVYGEGIWGVDHGKELNWGERGGRIGGAVAAGAGLAAGVCAETGFNPSLTGGKGAPAVPKGGAPKSVGGESAAAARGRAVHKEFAEQVRAKPGWQSEQRIPGTKLRPDAIDPKGRPVELKPNTPSGRAQGARQIQKYKEATGTNGRVIYYDR